MKLFMLLLHLQNPQGTTDTWVIDLDMSKRACFDMVLDYDIHTNPMVMFECVKQQPPHVTGE